MQNRTMTDDVVSAGNKVTLHMQTVTSESRSRSVHCRRSLDTVFDRQAAVGEGDLIGSASDSSFKTGDREPCRLVARQTIPAGLISMPCWISAREAMTPVNPNRVTRPNPELSVLFTSRYLAIMVTKRSS